MISIEYAPLTNSKNPLDTVSFKDIGCKTNFEIEDFYIWIEEWVCSICKKNKNLTDENEGHCKTVGDLLKTGCMAEIFIEGDYDLIEFDKPLSIAL